MKKILAVAAMLAVTGCAAGNKATKLPVGAGVSPVNLRVDESRIQLRDLSGMDPYAVTEDAPAEGSSDDDGPVHDPAVIFLDDDGRELTFEEADADLEHELALRQVIAGELRLEYEEILNQERAVALKRQAALEDELESLRAVVRAAAPAVAAPPAVAQPPAADQPPVREAIARIPKETNPARLREPAMDGPDSRERLVVVGAREPRPRQDTVPVPEPKREIQVAAGKGAEAAGPLSRAYAGPQGPRSRESLTSFRSRGKGNEEGRAIVEHELSKYRNFRLYRQAVRRTEMSREIRQSYAAFAAKEPPDGPYTKLLASLETLPSDDELRARYGIPAGWSPQRGTESIHQATTPSLELTE